jgi:CUE domain
VTAKEKLLERAPHWSEEQAERALRAAEGDIDEWGDLRAQTQELAEQAEQRLKERERAADGSW